ncbi:hypothetical protein BS47DRAFT_648121 [Hydnum rufescens UP504]|uniref:Uncharacterized protein n=1 Tax=Hydnum rufescens UP504 TaxID=1448309 RepID=A0A9P6E293_9AGAM|nr:hypothetical protein BS47DRAFT_648121 [Hydnum rufescens UP504]
MAEDPDGILDIIDKVGSHPLWQVYLLPETLGLLFHALSDPGISSGAVVAIGGLMARLQIPESILAIASCPPQLSSELDVDGILSWREMQSSIADLYNNPQPSLTIVRVACEPRMWTLSTARSHNWNPQWRMTASKIW